DLAADHMLAQSGQSGPPRVLSRLALAVVRRRRADQAARTPGWPETKPSSRQANGFADQPGDQFMPWAAYDAAGRLRGGYFARSCDAANHKYGYTLATESTPGSLTFSRQQVTTALSDPTRGRPLVRRHREPGLPLRDPVHRRLQRDRDDPGPRRRLLDRH